MADTFLAQAATVQARLAVPVLAIPVLVYIIAWNWEPYVFAYSVLGLAPLQLAWSLAGAFFAAKGVATALRASSLVLSAALATAALGAYFALRAIKWA